MPDFVNIFLLISLADLSNSSEAEYWDPGLTFLYKLGTVSMLWLKTSGLASTTFLYESFFLKKSGVKTSIVVFLFIFLVSNITSEKCFAPPSLRSSLSTDVITTTFKFNSLVAWDISFS